MLWFNRRYSWMWFYLWVLESIWKLYVASMGISPLRIYEIIKLKLYISCRESFAYLITQNNTVADLLWFIYSVLQKELNCVYFEWRNITWYFISRFSFILLLVTVNMKTTWLCRICQQYGMNHSFSGRPHTSTTTTIDNNTGRWTYISRQNNI